MHLSFHRPLPICIPAKMLVEGMSQKVHPMPLLWSAHSQQSIFPLLHKGSSKNCSKFPSTLQCTEHQHHWQLGEGGRMHCLYPFLIAGDCEVDLREINTLLLSSPLSARQHIWFIDGHLIITFNTGIFSIASSGFCSKPLWLDYSWEKLSKWILCSVRLHGERVREHRTT